MGAVLVLIQMMDSVVSEPTVQRLAWCFLGGAGLACLGHALWGLARWGSRRYRNWRITQEERYRGLEVCDRAPRRLRGARVDRACRCCGTVVRVLSAFPAGMCVICARFACPACVTLWGLPADLNLSLVCRGCRPVAKRQGYRRVRICHS